MSVYPTLWQETGKEDLMIPATVLAAVFLAFVGTLCVFRPVHVQGWFQRQHNKSNKFVQNYPFARLVFKPWYPAYLRFMEVLLG